MMSKAVEKLTEFDVARYLDTPERIAAYINEALSYDDSDFLEDALLQAERARAMHGLPSPDTESPSRPIENGQAFDLVRRTLKALGMRMQVEAA